MTINEKIKKLRKKANLTQEALAAVLNISYQSVSKWEAGIWSGNGCRAYPLLDYDILEV